jgi:hypothetical protein
MEVRSIELIVKTLNDAGVQYLIVGGLAVNAHGFVRLTRDVGIVLRLERENVIRALEALGKAGYKPAIPERAEAFADPETRQRWRHERNIRPTFLSMNPSSSRKNCPAQFNWKSVPVYARQSSAWNPSCA